MLGVWLPPEEMIISFYRGSGDSGCQVPAPRVHNKGVFLLLLCERLQTPLLLLLLLPGAGLGVDLCAWSTSSWSHRLGICCTPLITQ